MTDFKIQNAITALGITKSEAEILDSMDGKKDGTIEWNVFDEAKKTMAQVRSGGNGTDITELIETPVYRAMEGTINKVLDALGLGIETYEEEDASSGLTFTRHRLLAKSFAEREGIQLRGHD